MLRRNQFEWMPNAKNTRKRVQVLSKRKDDEPGGSGSMLAYSSAGPPLQCSGAPPIRTGTLRSVRDKGLSSS